MIVVKIIGGLGNQMFQYALGKSLAQKNNVTFKIDISGFEKYKLHKYSLDAFNIEKNIATESEIATFLAYKQKKGRKMFLYNFFYNLFRADNSKYIEEKGLGFNSWVMDLDGDMYLDGYWQCEKYFKDIEQALRKDFTCMLPQGEKDKEVAARMLTGTPVSIHIRRADYVTNASANKVYGTCSLEYYKEAVELIAKKVESPHFFVFSDDHAWVKENIQIAHPTVYVDHNDASTNYQDLRLMSLCKHNIIANSSFSWWGAWLNPNPDKIVIAPMHWFADPTKDGSDIVPSSWTTL